MDFILVRSRRQYKEQAEFAVIVSTCRAAKENSYLCFVLSCKTSMRAEANSGTDLRCARLESNIASCSHLEGYSDSE